MRVIELELLEKIVAEDILSIARNLSRDDMEPIVRAKWTHYRNDEGKARWKCGNCGKICHRNPHDKKRCSVCGAHMEMEA